MIGNIKNKALKKFWEKGDATGIRPDWVRKIERILLVLRDATKPQDLDLPGLGFHALRGDMAGRYALTVSRNWRLTFAWFDDSAIDVDLEDYHD